MDSPQLIARVAAELDLLSAPGEELNTDSPRSTVNIYTPEELALRATDFAIEYLQMQSGIGTDGLAAVVTAGPPGAGKSTILEEEGFRASGCRDIDADAMKEIILRRATKDQIFGDLFTKRLADGSPVRPLELATLVHRESTAVIHNVTQVCLRRGENLLLQGTLGWEEQPHKLLHSLEAHGYGDLTIVDVEVDLHVALHRARNRWWTKRIDLASEFGGRFVPSHLIRDMYLPDGGTKCGTNAKFMFEISTLPASKLITAASAGTDSETRSNRYKLESEEVTAAGHPVSAFEA